MNTEPEGNFRFDPMFQIELGPLKNKKRHSKNNFKMQNHFKTKLHVATFEPLGPHTSKIWNQIHRKMWNFIGSELCHIRNTFRLLS